MNKTIKILMALLILSLITISCRKEVVINETSENNQGITAGSKTAQLIKEVTLHDGSFDNIIDKANNISIKMPYTVIVNGQTITIHTKDDLAQVENILDQSDFDVDTIQIVFPVTLILPDYTEVVVHNQAEFDAYVAQSTHENEPDDDIECVDFVYPLSLQIFNTITEQTREITVNNDEELHHVLAHLDDHDVLNFQFPITLKLADGSEISLHNLQELSQAIEQHQDDCDEDDDNDYHDDDCTGCTTQLITGILTACPNWWIDELDRNNTDLSDNYENYYLHFLSNGTLNVTYNSQTYIGQWQAQQSGNQIVLQINITDLADLSGNWQVEKIENDTQEKKLKLSIDDHNKMKLKSNCP